VTSLGKAHGAASEGSSRSSRPTLTTPASVREPATLYERATPAVREAIDRMRAELKLVDAPATRVELRRRRRRLLRRTEELATAIGEEMPT